MTAIVAARRGTGTQPIRRCPHRRAVLAGLGGALAAPLLPIVRVDAQVPAFRRRVGSVDVTVVSDGTLSVLRHDWADPAQKADVVKEDARARDDVIGEHETPPPRKRTDSREALGAR